MSLDCTHFSLKPILPLKVATAIPHSVRKCQGLTGQYLRITAKKQGVNPVHFRTNNDKPQCLFGILRLFYIWTSFSTKWLEHDQSDGRFFLEGTLFAAFAAVTRQRTRKITSREEGCSGKDNGQSAMCFRPVLHATTKLVQMRLY